MRGGAPMGHGQGEHTAWGCVWGHAADAVPQLDKGTRSGFALWGRGGSSGWGKAIPGEPQQR